MKGLFGFTIGAVLLICFSSCQKEIVWKLNNRTQSDSIFIKSVFIIDTVSFGDRDTIFKFLFDYDDVGRISRIKEYGSYESMANTYRFQSDIKFTYLGSDTLPSVLYIVSSFNLTVFDTVYLTYNNGVIIKDSSAYGILGAPASFVLFSFRELGNNRIQGSYIDSTIGVSALRNNVNSSINWQSGNLLSEKDTFIYTMPVSSFIEDKEYTYDQKPNPLRKALLNFPMIAYYSTNSNSLTMAQGCWYLKSFFTKSVNNILTETRNPGNEVTTWDYTYKPNGLPKKAIRYRGGTMYKFIYNYINL